MVEILICSLLTILPDYLYRRYGQGKRFGHEITLYSVWFELRWGIVGCLMLTVSLITVIFYNHPSTTNATLFFRTVPIVPEASGRVAEIHVRQGGKVGQGEPIFRLDDAKQQAAVEAARRKVGEVEAALAHFGYRMELKETHLPRPRKERPTLWSWMQKPRNLSSTLIFIKLMSFPLP